MIDKDIFGKTFLGLGTIVLFPISIVYALTNSPNTIKIFILAILLFIMGFLILYLDDY